MPYSTPCGWLTMFYTGAPMNLHYAVHLLLLSVLSGLSTQCKTQKPVAEIYADTLDLSC